jgi:protein TonB
LGEQGKVVIRVLIDKDGKPQQGEIGQSSGYTRLDQAALHAVMAWRYVPGRRDGTAQDMWFNVPIHFALQ